MNHQQIAEMWKQDSRIDRFDLAREYERIYDLQAKYWTLYGNEVLKMEFIESELKGLKLQKQEFYIQGASKESKEAGWELPPRGKVLRQDVSLYMEADTHIQKKNLQLEGIKLNVALYDTILKMIINRGYILNGIAGREDLRTGVR